MVKITFQSLDEVIQWQDKASDSILKGRSVEVGFVHRSGCAHIVGTQRSGADQRCPCRPRPVLAYQ